MEENNKKSFSIREKTIGAIAAIILSPIGIIVGFHLNNFLARENLEITNVMLLPEYYELVFDSERLFEIKNSILYKTIEDNRLFEYDELVCRIFESKQKTLKKGDVNTFVNQLSSILTFTEKLFYEYNAIKIYIENYQPNLKLPDLKYIGPIMYYDFKNQMNRNKALQYIDNSIVDIKKNDLKIKGLKAISETYEFKRTGLLKITVIVQNKGNTDGLINGHGKLLLIDRNFENIELKAYEQNQYNNLMQELYYKTVSKRSFGVIEYWINEEETKPNSLNLLKSAAQNNNAEKVKIILFNTRNHQIKSKIFVLPTEVKN